jgi:superfamily II RNA helicase
MILLPREVNLVLLSATIAEPQWFASWLGDLKQKPIWLIPTTHRVVPLTHYIMMADGQMRAVMDAGETFHADVYKAWLQEKQQLDKQKKAFARAVADRKEETKQSRATAYRPDELAVVKEELASRGGVDGKVEDHSYVSVMNRTVRRLRDKELLPALFFCFSRRGCEQYAGQVDEELLSGEESAGARNSFLYQLRAHRATLEKVPQYHQVLGLVVRGVAFHHSGLLPVLKEAIEILFSKGFIKVLFCTETFAVGINMPTKTAVFTGLKKYDEKTQGQRVLTTDEYIQMAGRAGRRGLDKLGTVLYLPDREPVTGEELKTMMKSGMPSITSRMEFGYEFILKTAHSASVEWLELLKDSYWYRQAEAQLSGRVADLERLQNQLEVSRNDVGELYMTDITQRDEIETGLRGLFKGNKDYQRRLDQWKNKHMGPRWEEAWKKYQTMKKVLAEATGVEQDIENLKAILDGAVLVEKSQAFLRKADYLDESSALSRKGLLATEINEGHPVLATELYLSGLLEKLSGEEIMAVMGAFVCEGKDEEEKGYYSSRDVQAPGGVIDALEFLEAKAKEMDGLERGLGALGCEGYWKLGYMWVEVCGHWLCPDAEVLEIGETGGLAGAICQDYGIYEGNFTRGIMKLSNLHEELMALATLDANVALMDKLIPLQGRIVRGLVIPDSLYLRV